MWPQPYLPPHPMMLEETRQKKLAAAKKKLKEYQQRNSPAVPAGAKTKKKKTGSSPETTTSSGCHSPGDSQYQELAVALQSSSMTINQLNENIESLKQQKKEVEHQLEEAKKANNEIHKAQTEQLEAINILTLEKEDLKTALYHTKRAARHFEEESKDLAGRLQYSLQRIQELERALCAVSTQQREEDRSSSCSEAILQRRLQQTLKEGALLNAHVTQVTESLKQVHLQREEYAHCIKAERARWQERMRKISVETLLLKEEKKRDIHRIQELERSLSEFQNRMAEPPSLAPPAVTSVVEQLQDEAKQLRKEVEVLEGKLQSQVKNNQALSLLSKEQKQRQRLQEQEQRLQEQEEQRAREQERLCQQKEMLREQGKRLRKQEQRLRKEEERLRREEERLRKEEERLALSQNHKLDKQLAEPQRGFEDLNNENKSAVHSEQGVKELQEKLDEEHLEAASQWNQQLETQLSLKALPGEVIQPSGATDGMRESFTVYESQGAVPNTRHQEMEDVIRLARNQEEIKVKLLELQELVLSLVGNHEGHGKFLTAAQNPADGPAPGAPAPQELGAAGEQDDFYEVSLDNSVEPAPGAAREGSPHDNPTAQQIVQLLPVMQDTQEHPGLPSKPCMPFFYRAAKNREINIIII
ncbi:golgin subfamily A member 6C-like [Nomascus leucogenys]|uniref:golgin subfamily A member 6C-like n=1 Tax=Nomascus leucogenys TaxID=61853 RepID=UPI00122D8599|nr:golgin subfamily A member 6C-like [Nomascus leucogenys]